MNRIVKIAAVVALCVAATTYAQGEGGRARRGGTGGRAFGGGRGGMSKMALLRSEQVQKEIKLTEEQTKKITEISTAAREESRGLFSGMGNFRDMSEEERTKARAEMTKKRAAMTKKTEKKLAAALQKPQIVRLDQIVLQLAGSAGLTSDYVKKGVKLTEDQVKKIQAVFKARDDEQRKMFADMRGAGGGRGGRGGGGADRSGMQEIREKMQALRKKADDSAMAVLTKEQKAGLEKLKGEKFELDRNSMRRGGRGGEGGRRGGAQDRQGGERRRPGADAGKADA